MRKKPIKINTEAILKAKKLFDVIGHKVRLDILKLILEKKEAYEYEIAEELKIEQATIVRYLKLLTYAGMLTTRQQANNGKQGRVIYFTLNEEKFKSIQDAIEKLELSEN